MPLSTNLISRLLFQSPARSISGGALTLSILLFHVPALAEDNSAKPYGAREPTRQVIEYNWQAIESYNRLEVETATATLKRAIRYAKQNRVGGTALSRTYMILGIVAVGGSGNAGQGRKHFIQALKIDPTITLDPLLATPEIQTTFDEARSEFRGSEAPFEAAPSGASLIHRPFEEQQAHTAVPVYVEAPEEVEASRVFIYYQKSTSSGFAKAEMQRIEDGWGYEVPCQEVVEPSVDYYMVGVDSRGRKVAQVGSRRSPLSVLIIATPVTGAPPSLPGRSPPEQCSTDCAPGDAACHNEQAGLQLEGDTCETTDECAAGFVCNDGACSKESAEEQAEAAPRYFLQIGPSVGFSYVTAGMPTDSNVPPDNSQVAQAWVKDDDSADDECSDSDADTTTYCVRVESPGFVPTYGLNATFGYYFSRRIAGAVSLRYQFSAGGMSQLANYLFGARMQYLVTKPKPSGKWISLHAGGKIGQIQPQPQQPEGLDQPFVRSGLAGISGGATLGTRLFENLGFYATPELVFLFPDTLFTFDVNAGVEISF